MRKNISLIVISFFVGCFLLFVWIWQGIYLAKSPDFSGAEGFFVAKGQGIKEIADNLKNRGIIKSPLFFRIYVLAGGAARKLQAGEYFLSSGMAIPEIVNKFVAGEVVKETLTLLEGWNMRDLGWHLENKGMFMAEELFELAGFPAISYSQDSSLSQPKDFSQDFDFLADKPKSLGLEGYLFPDTYEISGHLSLQEIVRKMLANFGEKITPGMKEEIASQKKSLFAIITMASLIEKEVRTPEDKKIVSGILWKRLDAGMPLQVDATIVYVTGKKSTKVSIDETKIDSFYNTYKYKGLPIGPICNPGLESIMAAIYPAETDYWYYLSTPRGETIFSRTFAQHNAAKAKYLK